MKGTAMALAMTVASASSCNFKVPPILVQKGARLSHVSCDHLSPSCCSALEDLVAVKGSGKGMSPGQVTKDIVGTCGRADQVIMYDCAVTKVPQIVPAGKEGKLRQIIKSKGCGNVEVKSTSKDGSGFCSYSIGGRTFQIDGVSTGCCAAQHAAAESIGAYHKRDQLCEDMYARRKREQLSEKEDQVNVQVLVKCLNAARLESQVGRKAATCGMIGACGKQDQLNIFKTRVKAMQEAKDPKEELLLLETFNFSVGGPAEMMALFMPSEFKGTTEDGAADNGSHIMIGVLGFVAGAAVTGLGATVLRRRTPSQDEYSEIVA